MIIHHNKFRPVLVGPR